MSTMTAGHPAGKRRDEVFSRFAARRGAAIRTKCGSGLGLSIARDIARSHGGDISLDDGPLGGLRASLRIPA